VRAPNPQPIEDTPTQRIDLGTARVRRIFDAARAAEFLEAMERRARTPNSELHALAIQLAMWTL
jgi:hypothetical protein